MNEEFTVKFVNTDIFKVEYDELDFIAQGFLLDSQELGFCFVSRWKWVKQL